MENAWIIIIIKSQNPKSVEPYLEFIVTVMQKTFKSQNLDSISMKPSLDFTALTLQKMFKSQHLDSISMKPSLELTVVTLQKNIQIMVLA